MHLSILGAGLLAAATALAASEPPAAAAPATTCPAAQAPLAEAFIAADCADCWASAAATGARATAAAWRLDWIIPTTADAPMAAAALPEAAERALRVGSMPGPGRQLQTQRGVTSPLRGLQLKVVSGPAWQGYIGLELSLRQSARHALPAGSTAWLALIEQVDAGSEGTAIARALVRNVAGPLPLDGSAGRALKHLRALRWPTTALPERLRARAWIEGPGGEVLAVAADRCH